MVSPGSCCIGGGGGGAGHRSKGNQSQATISIDYISGVLTVVLPN